MADEELDLFTEEEDGGAGEEWLTTFADLSMLLLVFFILLYSMSTLDTKKFSETFSSVTQALQGQLQQISTQRITQEEAGVLLDQVMMQKQIVESQRKVYSDVKTLQTEKGVEGIVSANFENGLITLRTPGDVLFAPGQTALTDPGKRVIAMLKDFFIQHPDQTIKIVGHTDDVLPAPGSRFADNWEVSALRAVNVLRYLMQLGVEPGRLTAVGLADFEPMVPNTTDENRAKNRRVEFILEKQVVNK